MKTTHHTSARARMRAGNQQEANAWKTQDSHGGQPQAHSNNTTRTAAAAALAATACRQSHQHRQHHHAATATAAMNRDHLHNQTQRETCTFPPPPPLFYRSNSLPVGDVQLARMHLLFKDVPLERQIQDKRGNTRYIDANDINPHITVSQQRSSINTYTTELNQQQQSNHNRTDRRVNNHGQVKKNSADAKPPLPLSRAESAPNIRRLITYASSSPGRPSPAARRSSLASKQPPLTKKMTFTKQHDSRRYIIKDCGHCPYSSLPIDAPTLTTYQRIRLQAHLILDHPETGRFARIVQTAIMVLIIVATIVVVIETLPSLRDNDDLLYILEAWIVISFTAEYILRLWSARSISRFVMNGWNLFDLLAILPFYLESVLDFGDSFRVLRIVRLSRLFKLLRLPHLVDFVHILGKTFNYSLPVLNVFVFVIFLALVVCASLVFEVERGTFDEERQVYVRTSALKKFNETQTPFQSIPGTMWLIMQTITGSGYGGRDVPVFTEGKLLIVVVALMGFLVLSWPISISGSFFQFAVADVQSQKYTLEELEANMRIAAAQLTVRFDRIRNILDLQEHHLKKRLQRAKAKLKLAKEREKKVEEERERQLAEAHFSDAKAAVSDALLSAVLVLSPSHGDARNGDGTVAADADSREHPLSSQHNNLDVVVNHAGGAISREVRTGSRRGSIVGPESRRGSIIGSNSRRGSIVGPGSRRGSIVGASSRRGSIVGPSSRRGSIVGPSSRRRSIVGPSSRRGSIVGPSSRRGSIVGPSSRRGSLVDPGPRRASLLRQGSRRGSLQRQGSRRGSLLRQSSRKALVNVRRLSRAVLGLQSLNKIERYSKKVQELKNRLNDLHMNRSVEMVMDLILMQVNEALAFIDDANLIEEERRSLYEYDADDDASRQDFIYSRPSVVPSPRRMTISSQRRRLPPRHYHADPKTAHGPKKHRQSASTSARIPHVAWKNARSLMQTLPSVDLKAEYKGTTARHGTKDDSLRVSDKKSVAITTPFSNVGIGDDDRVIFRIRRRPDSATILLPGASGT